MNRLWVVPVLCGLMIWLCAGAAADAGRYCRDSNAQLETAQEAAAQGQWDVVRRTVQTLRSSHEVYLRRAGWYASDDRLSDAGHSLQALMTAAETTDYAVFAAACCHASAAVQVIAQEQQWTWGALL